MRILVIGGAGYLGSELVKQLAKNRKNQIQILDNFVPRAIKRKANIELPLVLNIVNPLDVLRAMERFKPEVVVHLAAANSRPEVFGDFRKCAEVNYVGTANVANAIVSLKDKPRKLIFASSLAAEDPQSHFGISKRAAEDLLLSVFGRFPEFGVELNILRFSEIFGLSDSYTSTCMVHFLIDSFLAGANVVLHGVENSIDSLHISDAVDACEKVVSIEDKPGVYDIGTGEGLTIQLLVNKIREKTDYFGQLHYIESPKVPVETLIAYTDPATQAFGFTAQADFNKEIDKLIKKRKRITR